MKTSVRKPRLTTGCRHPTVLALTAFILTHDPPIDAYESAGELNVFTSMTRQETLL